MKRCATCHETKPLEEFSRRRASADGRQARCRQCARLYYVANAKGIRLAVDRRIARVQADNRRRLAAYLESHPCVDCGEDDLRVLDFDHREGTRKRANVARLMSAVSRPVIAAEIDKCDVRCANCHRRRTCERGAWSRESVQNTVDAQRASQAAARVARLLAPA